MVGSVANIGQGRKNSINRTQLSSESRKLRKAVPFQTKLFLADHLSLLDAFACGCRRTEGFEPEHRTRSSFDKTVILLNHIV